MSYDATIPDDIVRALPTVSPDATLRRSGARLALLPDESALVALEDMIGELVGEIHDSAHG